jgi:hypothetical protein
VQKLIPMKLSGSTTSPTMASALRRALLVVRAPRVAGALVLGIAVTGVAMAACSDPAGGALLGGAGGVATGEPGSDPTRVNGNAGPSNTAPVDGGIFADAGPEATKAETLFRGLQTELVASCGGTSGVCHVSGAYQSGQTPVWLGAPDPYVSAHAFPGIIVRDPYSSKLIVKGPHAGPAFSGNTKDLGDRVLAWLTQEALAIKVQALPGTDAFGVAGGPNTVDISGGGTGVAGAKITFDAAIDGTILTLTNVKMVAPAGTGVHIAHPVFTRVTASGKTVDDPVDSFSNLDQTQAAGTTQPLGTGFLILSSWSPSDKMKIGFTTLGAATVADAGSTGGCKSLATFVSAAVPAIQQNSCLNCHDQGGSGASALDLSSVGKDNARACAQSLNKVNLADKAKSAIIQAPTGGLGNHPFQNASGNYAAMMLTWINNE